ncbi:MAG: methionyl-tRNA formyltransferase [Planctomycetales bacterium]|nr:methionyl-tRNA formyltransferase [Planctomycetales bacterium]
MKLFMLGTGPFAVPTLRRLATSSHDVLGVITRPPRGRRPVAPPMQLAAEELGLPLWQPETLNCDEARTQLARQRPDLLVVCDYGEILKPDTLGVSPLGGVNLHASLLPKYRGAAPVQWALLNGETETGNTVIQMTPGLDAGPCLGVQRVAIDPNETAAELEARLAELGADLVLEVIEQLAGGTAQGSAQDASQMCKAPRLTKTDGIVDWKRNAQTIHNQVRGLDPWPRASTWRIREDGPAQRLILHQTRCLAAESAPASPVDELLPGQIVQAGPQLLVQCGDAPLEIVRLQPEGKKAMSAAEFLRGTSLARGESLGTPTSAE